MINKDPNCLSKKDCKSKCAGDSMLCVRCAAIARSSPAFRLNCSAAQKKRRDNERHLTIGAIVLQKCNPL